MSIAQIGAGVGIEESLDSFVGALHYNIVRLVGRLCLAYVVHFVGWVGSLRALCQFLQSHPVPGLGRDYRFAREHYRQLMAINDRAARDADCQNVNANPQPHPQVDLKKNLANSQTSGALNPSLPKC